MLYLQVTLLCVCCVQWIYVGVAASTTPGEQTNTPVYDDNLTTVVGDTKTAEGDSESTSDYPTTPNFDSDSSSGAEQEPRTPDSSGADGEFGVAAKATAAAQETSPEEKAAEPDKAARAESQLSATDDHAVNPDSREYYSSSDEEKGPKITLFSASGVLSDDPQFSTRTGGPHPSTDSGPTANTAQGYSSTTPYPPFSSQYFEDTKENAPSNTDSPLKKEEEYQGPSTERPSENDINEAGFDSKPYRPNFQISSNYIDDSQPSESKTTLLSELTNALRAALQNPDERENANLQISTYLADTNAASPLKNYTAEHNATIEKLADSISAYLSHEEDQKESETAVAPNEGSPGFEPTAPVDEQFVTPSMKPIIVTDFVYYSPQPVYNPAYYYETGSVEDQTVSNEFESSQNSTRGVSVDSVESYSHGESGQLKVQPRPVETPTSEGTTQHTTTAREASTFPSTRVDERSVVTPSKQDSYDYAPSASDQVEIANLKNYQIFGQKIIKDNQRQKEVDVEKQEVEAKPVFTTVVEIQKSIPLEIKEVGPNYDIFVEPNAKTPNDVVQEVIGNNVEQTQPPTANDYQQPQQPLPNEYQEQPSTVEYQQPQQPLPNEYQEQPSTVEYQQPQQPKIQYQLPQQPTPTEYQLPEEHSQPQPQEYRPSEQQPQEYQLSQQHPQEYQLSQQQLQEYRLSQQQPQEYQPPRQQLQESQSAQQQQQEYQPVQQQQQPQEYQPPQQTLGIEYPRPQLPLSPQFQQPVHPLFPEYLTLEQYQAQRYQEGAQQVGNQNILLIQTLPALIPAEVIGNTIHPLREQQEQLASENRPYASHFMDHMTAIPAFNPEPAFIQPPQQQNGLGNLEQPVQTHFPTKHHSLHYNLINEPHYGRPAVPTYSPILYHRLYGDKTNSHKGYRPVKAPGPAPAPAPHAIPVPLTKILPPAPVPIALHYNVPPQAPQHQTLQHQPPQHQPTPYTGSNFGAPLNYSPFANTIRESAPENRLPYGHSFPYGKSKISFEKLRQQILRYDPHSRNPPFRPSMQLYDSVYPPQMFYEERYVTKSGSNGRGTRGTFAKKLCVEYGGFKPPLIPSVEIKDDPATSFAKKSDKEN